MNEEVLREFLVSLGFEVDETGFKKFNTAVESVTKGVVAAGVAVAATAAGIVAGVKVISNQMENLYYASQRTGATVGNLMALRFAAGQIGLTADQAQASLENFTRTLRLNPGTDSLLSSLGVSGKDPTERFESFIAKMKNMQPYVAAAYAGLFGIDPDTLLMLENGLPKLQDEQKRYRDLLMNFGLSPDQAAGLGKDFNNEIRRAKEDFELLWVVIESKLLPVLTPLIDQFERWAETHAGELAEDIADGVQQLASWIGSVDWHQTGKDISDLIAGVRGLIDSLKDLSNTKFSIGGTQQDWAELKNILTTIINTAHALGAVLHGDFKTADSFAGQALNSLNSIIDTEVGVHRVNGAPVSNDAGDFSDFGKISVERDAPSGQRGDDGNQPFGTIIEVPNSRAPRGIRNNNPGNLQSGHFASQHGAVGSDGDFATFATMQDGIRAAAALLQSYAARGIDTVRSIISRWAPGSENNTAAYIADVTKKLGLSPDAHLSADQLSGVAQAIFEHENGAKYGGAGALMSGIQGTRLGASGAGGRSVTIQQKTDIHVSGTSDPQGTARATASEQSRVNGDLVRNFSSAVQ